MVLKKASAIASNPNTAQAVRGLQEWLTLLDSQDTDERRLAARALGEYSVATPALLNALAREKSIRVKGAILVSLQCIGGHRVLEGLLPFLRSENAALRNGVIEILQGMPEEIGEYIKDLLHDHDSDVRIFAIDILQTLAHPDSPNWLIDVILHDKHINVVATAIDRLTEIGTPEMLPAISAVKARFPGEPYIEFVVNLAVKRLTEE
jgi:HEAT repeat protein